eukprot:gene8748-33609_t
MKELITVLPGSVADHVDQLAPGVIQALKEKSSSSSGVKIEALQYLRLAMDSSPPSVFQPYVTVLAPAVFAAANERYYKVSAEALRVCELMVKVMAPPPLPPALEPVMKPMFDTVMQRLCAQDQDQLMVKVMEPPPLPLALEPLMKPMFDTVMQRLCAQDEDQLMVKVMAPPPLPPALEPVMKPMFDTVMQRLCKQDQDQEVKECAILAMSAMVKDLVEVLPSDELGSVLRVLLERLRNETTRLPSARAIAHICSSPHVVDMSSVLDAVLIELTSFLRKANRALRLVSLQTLEAVAAKYGASLSSASIPQCVEEASLLVSDADLSLASLSLKFFVTLIKNKPEVAGSVAEKVLPQAMVLVKSQLLQRGSSVLEILQLFFSQLSASGFPAASCESLLPQLLAAGSASDTTGKQAQHSVAQCVAVLACAAGPSVIQDTINKLLAAAPSAQRLSLLCLGEIGRRTDLSGKTQVEAAVSSALMSDSEEAKTAASLALGGITCGNLAALMPGLLQRVAEAGKNNPKLQYLLLHSLNEVIASISATRVGTSSMDSQASIEPSAGDKEQMLSMLLSNCDGEEECRNVVAECLGHATPGYADRHVRRAAVVSLSALAYQKQVLVVGQMSQLLPMLYAQTVIREDMIRTVDLGPFKHKIDDGLELRKAAFECLDILLESCRSAVTVDAGAFVQHLESGLKDHYDVKMPCHLMLSKLAATEPAAVLTHLDKLVEPLEKTLTAKLKSDAVKQEIDRHEDMLRSCLRAVDSLKRLQGSEASTPFQAFLKKTVMSAALKEKYAAVEKERLESEGASDSMDLS